jgi:hypothetical protein
MFCDRCGTPFQAGARYCNSCGKQLTGAQVAGAAVPGARVAGDGRVKRNITLLAGLWMAYGVLRLMELGWLTIFHRLLLGWGWGWIGPADWPFGGKFGLSPLIWGGMLMSGIFLALFGALYLLVAWGLLERQPWARILGIVLALLALIRIPFGTALGIYTLWVLLPESSGREYEGMAGARS